MCFVFYRITEVATVITRDNNISYFTINRERGEKISCNEIIKGILMTHIALCFIQYRSEVSNIRGTRSP